jgi:replicative DNA helicase Mcm
VRLRGEREFPDATISDKFIDAMYIDQIESIHSYPITIDEEDERKIQELSSQEDIYDKMVGSIAPAVFGKEDQKMAILLQLFSGVRKTLPDDTQIRGDIHIALIGDPGTAKSRLIEYAGVLAPRTVKISGQNTTSVGLTATMKKTSQGKKLWTFEAGALPLADNGLARIDNITDLHDENLRTLHDVLEDQTIELNKATVSTTIKARASILAAGNPKYGRFDQYEPIGEQLQLGPGLVSQFDLIFVVTDEPERTRDKNVANHVLQANFVGEVAAQPDEHESDVTTERNSISPDIDPALLRKYIAYARQNFSPVLSEGARERIQEFYVDLRSRASAEDAPLPVTARKLEGIIRIAEASARMRLSSEVNERDAERAIDLVNDCLSDIGVNIDEEANECDILETDTFDSRAEISESLMDLINSLDEDYEYGVPIGKVVESAGELDLSKSETTSLIDDLHQKGELYEPKEDHLRPT